MKGENAMDTNKNRKTVSIVVPVYNEVDAIFPFLDAIEELFATSEYLLEIVFVNDGSTDDTLPTLQKALGTHPKLRIVDLSRNFGKEAALSAGLAYSRGDAVIPMDVDLQDPPSLIPDMLKQWENGYEVVLAHRASRQSDSLLKRMTAQLFYKIHNIISTPKIPEDVGDYRLMDRVVVDAILRLPENCRFMKGLFAWVGFRVTSLDYVRQPREVGRSKFNGWKLWNFALEGITSFSTVPLRIWTYIGILITTISFFYLIYLFLRACFTQVDVPGYTSLAIFIIFFSGIQLTGIGVLGEYLGRIYIESKRRPPYVVRSVYEHNDDLH